MYEALEMLERQMLKEDRVQPNQYVFTVLIGVLGRVGYTSKAFDIFKKVCAMIFNKQISSSVKIIDIDVKYILLFIVCKIFYVVDI